MRKSPNNCTLEHCYTNIFSLTELHTLQWLRYTNIDNIHINILDDQVILSYIQCRMNNALAAWRLVNNFSQYELWVFWHGQDIPAIISSFPNTLQMIEQGSWTDGMCYEARVMLFRAIHNSIEKALACSYLRIGTCFIEPRSNYCFSFRFFLHETTVCAVLQTFGCQGVFVPESFDDADLAGKKIILAPWGMVATCVGPVTNLSTAYISSVQMDWVNHFNLPLNYFEKNSPILLDIRIGKNIQIIHPAALVLFMHDSEVKKHDSEDFSATPLFPSYSAECTCGGCGDNSVLQRYMVKPNCKHKSPTKSVPKRLNNTLKMAGKNTKKSTTPFAFKTRKFVSLRSKRLRYTRNSISIKKAADRVYSNQGDHLFNVIENKIKEEFKGITKENKNLKINIKSNLVLRVPRKFSICPDAYANKDKKIHRPYLPVYSRPLQYPYIQPQRGHNKRMQIQRDGLKFLIKSKTPCHPPPVMTVPPLESIQNLIMGNALFAVLVGLQDSLFNLFTDVNFDLSTLCVCNMTVKSPWNMSYCTRRMTSTRLDQCRCGYSSAANRMQAHLSCLFFADEAVLTQRFNTENRLWTERTRAVAMHCIQGAVFPSMWHSGRGFDRSSSYVEYVQSVGNSIMLYLSGNIDQRWLDELIGSLELFKIPPKTEEVDSVDVMCLMRSLEELFNAQLVLQSNKHVCKLTWTLLCKPLIKSPKDQSDPLPIPYLMTYSREQNSYVSFNPYSLVAWDKMQLAPYLSPKRRPVVNYIVLANDEKKMAGKYRDFFKLFNNLFHKMNLGVHEPVGADFNKEIVVFDKNSKFGDIQSGLSPYSEEIKADWRCETFVNIINMIVTPLIQQVFQNSSWNGRYFLIYVIDDLSEIERSHFVSVILQEINRHVSADMQNRIIFQFVEREEIMRFSEGVSFTRRPKLMNLAFSVYSQMRMVFDVYSHPDSYTGVTRDEYVKELANIKKNMPVNSVKLTPFILSPIWSKKSIISMLDDQTVETCDYTLHCTYTISRNFTALFAAICDENGEMLETNIINIAMVDITRVGVIEAALSKLWTFIQTAVCKSARPWRLVVAKMGRLGHEELKAWSRLVNRTTVRRLGQTFRIDCKLCDSLAAEELPALLSVCLISMHQHDFLRVFYDISSKEDSLFGSHSLQTPRDSCVSHIAVLPMSAHSMPATVIEQGGLMDDFLDICEDIPSPKDGCLHRMEPYIEQTDHGLIEQQPLAVGYYATTAHVESFPGFYDESKVPRGSAHVLRAGLHYTHPQIYQSETEQMMAKCPSKHPLDSTVTTDTLRHVLEQYNSLSWLEMDLTTNERRSGLPVHFQSVIRLGNSFSRLM